MTNRLQVDKLLDETGLYMMKEYGLDVLHVLEKIMCAEITQRMYGGTQDIDNMTPKQLRDYYISSTK